MLKFIINSLKLTYKAIDDVIEHDGIEHSGYMAFLAMLGLFPFLVFLVALTGFLGTLDVGKEFVKILLETIPVNVSKALMPRIQEIVSGPPGSLLTLSILGAIWTASSSVEGLRTALNRANRVHAPPSYIWRRLLSILQFLLITIALIISMFLLIVFPAFLDVFNSLIQFQDLNVASYWTYIRYGFSITILFVTVAWFYFILPNIKQRFITVLPGAFVVVSLWLLIALSFSKFLEYYHQVNIVYGSLAGIILALLFFYICSFILIFGAELNYHIKKATSHNTGKRSKSARSKVKAPKSRKT